LLPVKGKEQIMVAGHPQRVTAKLFVTTVVAVALGACGTYVASYDQRGTPENDGLPAVAHVPQLLESVDLKLPLDAHLPSMEDVHRYGMANRALITRCMQRFKIDFAPSAAPASVGLRSWNERRYGLTDPSAAAALGYGLGARTPRDAPSRPSQRLDSRGVTVLSGEPATTARRLHVPDGGCSGQARRALTGRPSDTPPLADPYLAQHLSQLSLQESRRDPRVRAAVNHWSQCMLAKNHHYDDPFAPFADPANTRGATPRAVDTAVDDVTCKKRTNLIGIWFSVDAAYQKRLIAAHRNGLMRLAQADAATAAAIARVLGGAAEPRRPYQ
jgi:hypothetical protein